ncbi:hypothetical protein J7L13_00520 [bacterium]|nr:hypothetical protein [bacterium]
MSKKKLALIIAAVIIVVFVVAAALNTPSKGQIILNGKAEYTPKTYYTAEFTAEKPGKLKIRLQASDSEANILWYLCDVNETAFNQAIQEGRLFEITYKSDITGSPSIETEVSVDKTGTFTFAFIQTSQWVQNREISVYLEFIPES